jgi:hypothetical protein
MVISFSFFFLFLFTKKAKKVGKKEKGGEEKGLPHPFLSQKTIFRKTKK